jgi:four helix bundle protein
MVQNFEELIIWKDARQLANAVHNLFFNSKDFGFRDQINRAAVSVMNNIAEGFERYSNGDFKRFLQFSKASCSEVRSMFYLAMDYHYITADQSSEIINLCIKIKTGTINLIKALDK